MQTASLISDIASKACSSSKSDLRLFRIILYGAVIYTCVD
ncbi:hypothetical protein SVI_3767 [Shewanella violacea DSS12]|uniref:Uncharacterized protein n=1 Tax=Shewanella violacea (strain JCM 10179 / CIP 106290 / LMG 19151 / DSS12) TaxID=637905 RepID=D4ZCJ3_SHEVD|nr:hypothetical protein SVI_3767 [Shewanella violacea DSS12]